MAFLRKRAAGKECREGEEFDTEAQGRVRAGDPCSRAKLQDQSRNSGLSWSRGEAEDKILERLIL